MQQALSLVEEVDHLILRLSCVHTGFRHCLLAAQLGDFSVDLTHSIDNVLRGLPEGVTSRCAVWRGLQRTLGVR